MKLPAMQEGLLIKRYKRFLADIETADGEQITAHCPNTGAMTGCAEPGWPVWYSQSDNPKRKYPHTFEFVDSGAGLVSVNTGRANTLVREAIEQGMVAPLGEIESVRAEARIPQGNGRFDFVVESSTGLTWVEVKSVTLLVGDGEGAFPDAVSARALKHLNALMQVIADGDNGMLIFCAQHCGIEKVRAALEVDPEYAQGLRDAKAAGVQVLAYGCATDLNQMSIDRSLPVQI